MASIFTRIIRGEIPSDRVYEDSAVVAFLDVTPLSPGHVLVVPVEEKEYLHQLSEESAAALGRALPRVARAVLAATGAAAYNILQNNGALANQAVMHVHFHIIPKFEDGRGLGLVWKASKAEPNESAELAARIRERIGE
ncbi:MAG: HIT family protein [Phycisphaerales bacterium]|nr:HIT family protein [Phycisphaerales bacterium]